MRGSSLQSASPNDSSLVYAGILLSIAKQPNLPEKNDVNGQTKSVTPDTSIVGEGEMHCAGAPIVLRKGKEEDIIVEQWLKCVNNMTTQVQIRFLGEYMLYKCVNMWHTKSFNLRAAFVCDITKDESLIWIGIISDLMSFIKRFGRRYAASMMRRSAFKKPRKSQVDYQAISKLALEWAIGAVDTLFDNVTELPCLGRSVPRFCTKHNQFNVIDDNMQTIKRIAHTYTRVIADMKREDDMWNKRRNLHPHAPAVEGEDSEIGDAHPAEASSGGDRCGDNNVTAAETITNDSSLVDRSSDSNVDAVGGDAPGVDLELGYGLGGEDNKKVRKIHVSVYDTWSGALILSGEYEVTDTIRSIRLLAQEVLVRDNLPVRIYKGKERNDHLSEESSLLESAKDIDIFDNCLMLYARYIRWDAITRCSEYGSVVNLLNRLKTITVVLVEDETKLSNLAEGITGVICHLLQIQGNDEAVAIVARFQDMIDLLESKAMDLSNYHDMTKGGSTALFMNKLAPFYEEGLKSASISSEKESLPLGTSCNWRLSHGKAQSWMCGIGQWPAR